MKSTTLALATFLLGTTTAIPSVVPVPLNPSGAASCVGWPSTQGAFKVQVSSSEDDAFNDFPIQPTTTTWGSSTLELLGANLLKSYRYAKAPYFCVNGELRVGASQETVGVSKDMRNAFPLLQVEDPESTYEIEVYAHEIDGVRQEGVFLGAQNKTTWGFNYVRPTCGAEGAGQNGFFQVKLLDLPVDEQYPPTAGYDPEFQGFLKLTVW
ncbi:hypothetical protein BS50DRAFT_410600 [Corynespora cassiicola Philippines]|uniref:Ubiquitin 3 binding protein But2 C-terminal domain-containing protein n=1 Tax=Corynespora cassiicola Philippines TaxID=1448308 RepID=A0A2T2NLE4_CORCC|nr:hypothetical protein BS50DRAFT_410600 [Corynespora cassiicola Philippines]